MNLHQSIGFDTALLMNKIMFSRNSFFHDIAIIPRDTSSINEQTDSCRFDRVPIWQPALSDSPSISEQSTRDMLISTSPCLHYVITLMRLCLENKQMGQGVQ